MRKAVVKDDKPVNISISFNISPNEILKPQQRDKCSPGDIRGRKIRNNETLKSHRDTPLNTFFVPFSAAVTHRPDELTDRETFSRDDPQPRKKRKLKRQSMDGIFETRGPPDSLFISCENEKLFEQGSERCRKPDNAAMKFTPLMSTKRKPINKQRTSQIKQPATNISTRSELKSGRLQSQVLKSLLSKKQGNFSIDGLRQLISKLVTEELQKHQPKLQRNKATSKDFKLSHPAQPPQAPPKSQRRLKERKKSMEFTRRTNQKKRPTSKQSNREVVVKLNSLKEMNDSSLIKSDASEKEILSSTVPLLPMSGMRDIYHPLPNNPTLKTSASQANLRELVRVQYPPNEQPSREYSSVQEMMAIRIQRFWRQYRTKKLVKLYINLLHESEQGRNYLMNELEYYRVGNQNHYKDELQHDEQNFEDREQLLTPRDRAQRLPHPPEVSKFLNPDREDVSEIIEQYQLQVRMKQQQPLLKSPDRPAAVNNITDRSDLKEIKQLHSLQLGRQEQPKDVAQFKRRQLNKWDETLAFLSRNIDKADMKDVLLQVMRQLEVNKTLLEKEINHVKTDKGDLASFTVALKSKKEQLSEGVSEYSELEKQIGQLGQSYVSDEPNQQLNLINFKSIHSALNNRKKALQMKKGKELQVLENKLESNRITQQVYDKERQRLNRWIKHEQAEIIRAKQHLERGLVKAKHIMEKTHGDDYFIKKMNEKQQKSVSSQLKRCLSDTFIREAKLHSRTGGKPSRQRVHTESEEESNDQESRLKRSSEQLSAKRLKEKLRDLSHNFNNESESPQISYESLSREYNENSEDELQERNIIRNQLQNLRDEEPSVQGLLSSSYARRMAVLDDSDKDDIFEFIFLDLCIEFCQEEIQEGHLQLVRQFIQKLRKPPPKKPKGIKTNLTIVKEYLKRFISFVTRTSRQLMDRVCIPMGPSALEMLRYMHYSEDDAEDQDEDLIGALVLPSNTFEAFENSLLAGIEFEPYYDDPEREHNRIQFLKGVIHIHNKAIFDSLNESLDLERPFGIWGKPFPWKKVPEFAHQLSFERKEDKFKKATDRVVQNCTYVCGIIIDKEDSLVNPGARLSQEYVETIREDRLSRMLATDVHHQLIQLIESEDRFVFYDDEQTQVLVEISQLAYQLILREAVREVISVRDRLL